MSGPSSQRSLVDGLFVVLLTIAVVFIMQSESTVETASTMDIVRSPLAGAGQSVLKIMDWNTYTKTFHKDYLSLPQMLLRQSLFLKRLHESFITSLKHHLKLLSYHTTINRYSDATDGEIRMLFEHDSGPLDEEDFTDDEAVDRILDSMQQGLGELSRPKRDAANDDIWSSKGSATKKEKAEKDRVQSIMDTAFDWVSSSRTKESDESDRRRVIDGDAQRVTVHQDWRESGCIGLPRDQGNCQSCYAFSSTAFAEWSYCRHQGGKFTRLSPQYVINCGSRYKPGEFFGCNRGPIRLVPDFFREYGLELEKNVPYEEETKECHINDSMPKERWGSIRPIVEPTIRMRNNTVSLDKAIKTRPVIASMFVSRDFIGYGGGFISDCEPGDGGHAVLLVGSGTEDGVDYMLAQNSLGAFWGLQGYFKIKRTPDYFYKCIKHFMVPVIKFS